MKKKVLSMTQSAYHLMNENSKINCYKYLAVLSFFFTFSFNNIIAQSVEIGESLFSSNCASCHYAGPEDKKLIGPGLNSHILEEYSTEWLYSWIRNSSALIASGDEQAISIYEEYNKVAMTAFPYFSDEDIDNILAYIEVGPKDVVDKESSEDILVTEKTTNPNIFLFVFFIILMLLSLVLTGIKNSLKEVKGEPIIGLFESFTLWLKANPLVIVLFCIFLFLNAGRIAWNELLAIGVQQGYQPEQPIAFSHKIHAGENGVDCNYCHSGARHSKSAGVPSANICMNCHTYISEGPNTGSVEIAKIYDAIGFDPETKSYIEGYQQKPIKWVRIHNLPDLAYFNHSQHVNVAGVECQTCHGPIEEMEVVEQYSTLTMGWCIDCHRETKIDLNNPYYHDLNKNWVKKFHGEDMTAEKIGGLECGKCHY